MADSSHDLSKLERALRALEPTPSRIHRDRLMYAAGQSAARAQRLRVWASAAPYVAAAMLLVTTVIQTVRLQNSNRDMEIVQQNPQVERAAPEMESVQLSQQAAPDRIAEVATAREIPQRDRLPQLMPQSPLIAQRNLLLYYGVDAYTSPRVSSTRSNMSLTLGQMRAELIPSAWIESTSISIGSDNQENIQDL